MRVETLAERARGATIHARALRIDNPTALVYAPRSCGGEEAGERATVARAVRDHLADEIASARYRACGARVCRQIEAAAATVAHIPAMGVRQ